MALREIAQGYIFSDVAQIIHYRSLRHASAKMEIPVAMLKKIRDAGCDGFVGKNIYPGAIFEWLVKNPGFLETGGDPRSKEEWQIEEIKARVEKIGLQNQEIRGQLIRVEDTITLCRTLGARIQARLRRAENDLAPAVSDRPIDEARQQIRAFSDAFCVEIAAFLDDFRPSDDHVEEPEGFDDTADII